MTWGECQNCGAVAARDRHRCELCDWYCKWKKEETKTSGEATVSESACPDCSSLMLYYPHSGDLICPECGCWLLQEIPDAIEKVADVLDEDVGKFVDEVD